MKLSDFFGLCACMYTVGSLVSLNNIYGQSSLQIFAILYIILMFLARRDDQ